MSQSTTAPTVIDAGDSSRLRAPGAPLGPGTRLWRIAGDWRSGLSGFSAGILQLMYPHLGRGVEEHSAFFTEPWDRIYRSVPQIWATILADDADDRGTRIRDYHRDIGGTDAHGERYHALHPETYWWAHATFTWEMFETVDRWSHQRLRGAAREELYQETVTWYRRYGVSDRPVPPDERSFRQRFDEICRNELELTPTAERAVDMALHSKVESLDRPAVVDSLMTPIMRTITIGGLPAIVRKRFGIPWTMADEARLAAITLTVRNAGEILPQQLTRGPYLRRIRKMKDLAAPHPEPNHVAS
ncbi:MAG: oxygenase MpaB family protein [Acidimicrobiales bacterium]|nr:oxygenase MpaB family protein [Acidimicrobiales bacterium]